MPSKIYRITKDELLDILKQRFEERDAILTWDFNITVYPSPTPNGIKPVVDINPLAVNLVVEQSNVEVKNL